MGYNYERATCIDCARGEWFAQRGCRLHPHSSRLRHSNTGVQNTMSLRWCLPLFLLVSYFPTVHAAVQYYPERKVWVLQAGEATYAMGVNERGELQSIYWGPRVMRDADFSPAQSLPRVAAFDLSTNNTP